MSIRALEEQIRGHEMAIVKLKRARNSFLNVSRLPPEVLGEIFRWSVTREMDFERLEEGSHNFLLVCHHWFEVASRTPEVWSFWGDNLEDWTRRHLRHQTAPLDLVFNGGRFRESSLDGEWFRRDSLNDSLQDALQDRAARDTIRQIHLSARDSEILDSIISLLGGYEGVQSSCVQSVIIRDGSQHSSVDVSDLFTYYRFPELRTLELTNCTISSWDLIMSRTSVLTTLTLDIHYYSPEVTSFQILSVLRSNHSLRKITLRGNAVPCDGGDKSSRVPLGHLRRLALSGDPEDVFPLLHQLDYPTNMDSLALKLTNTTTDDISKIIGPYLREHLGRRGRSRSGLGLDLSFEDTISFHVGDVDGMDFSAPGRPRMDSLVATSIHLDQVPPWDSLEEVLLDLIAHVHREEIVYFRARSRPISTEAISAQFPNLRAMYLDRTPLDVAFPKSTLDQDRMFLHLQHLTLDWVDECGDNWSPLTTFLDHLASSGNKLDTLEIGGSFDMHPRVEERVRSAVREFRMKHDFFYFM